MQIVFFSFSKKFLSLDFFSRIFADKTIVISAMFLKVISSITSLILSLALEIIISFLSSKKDFVKILLKNSFLFSNYPFSSYLYIWLV